MQKAKNLTAIYIVRHGEAEHNVNQIMQGGSDSPLTQTGVEQVQILARELRKIHFDVVFSSDLRRAKRTAEIVNLERQLAINTTHLLRERNYGVYEEKTGEDFRKENQVMLEKLKSLSEQEKRSFRVYPSYETNDEIVARMLTFLREVATAYQGKSVLAVSHGAIMRGLLTHLGFAKYEDLGPGSLANTAYIILESDGVDFFVKKVVGYEKREITF